MRDNTLLLLVAEVGLLLMALTGLVTGENRLAYMAAGAFSGLLAGHLNGAQAVRNGKKGPSPPP